ncbi:YbhB/YbcL family Raf kinase inhibitor-like protein [Archaeoglobus neptunius]|uniref:YbhB/YbcL family Raf kinase inhibitor-like protein n=1 Tax=Archaeoglobus neptunius TaxID=2798580 RepID=UPI001925DD09|nr:YbhB/YbcL family Raf kinase inhibitor-like protein [Archaeoglobus neptunius]
MRRVLVLVILVALTLAGCTQEKHYQKTLTVRSVFGNGDRIPKKYTCDGEDVSPPLYIDGLGKNVKSLVIICEDPDAPGRVFTHWIAWNVQVVNEIPENIPKSKEVIGPVRMVQGKNDFGKIGYSGPCPPSGVHRYYFRVFAIDTTLDGDFSREELLKAIENHVLQYGEIYGVYSR